MNIKLIFLIFCFSLNSIVSQTFKEKRDSFTSNLNIIFLNNKGKDNNVFRIASSKNHILDIDIKVKMRFTKYDFLDYEEKFINNLVYMTATHIFYNKNRFKIVSDLGYGLVRFNIEVLYSEGNKSSRNRFLFNSKYEKLPHPFTEKEFYNKN